MKFAILAVAAAFTMTVPAPDGHLEPVVLAAAALDSPIKGLIYVLLFGFGSMLGMALLSIVISVPLRFTARFMTWSHLGIRGAAGLASVGLGVAIIW